MGAKHPTVDVRGARGSNAGDQFHEYWALEQVLGLLQSGTKLRAVSVEGVVTETAGADDPKWDGVDCALYFGAPRLGDADAIEFAQLKYSAANPQGNWTIARLASNTAKKGNNSVIRRMADDYKDANAKMKAGASLKIKLVSNQGVADGVKQALASRWTGKLSKSGLDKKVISDLETIRKTGGLTEPELPGFLQCLDFSETAQGSRFATKSKVYGIVAASLGHDIISEARELEIRIRELMLPERAREIVTEDDVLLWFGLSGRDGLLPAPADIKVPETRISRPAAEDTLKLLAASERLLLVHGEGGCGKTTLMREITDRLPPGSKSILFDCFGGGRCIYSDDKRHLASNAFLQITNELALSFGLPLFIPRNFKHPATIKSFLDKARTAGKALHEMDPGALLVFIFDAADNSVTAADHADPKERAFVHDFAEADLADLPANVRFIVSARTARKSGLKLPASAREVVCPPFTPPETRKHLEIAFGTVSDELVEQFHSLSDQNPRVQSYAISGSNKHPSRAIEVLLPGGKVLANVLETTFEVALEKLGQRDLFDKFVATLAYLPAPAALSAIAGITGASADTIRDLVLDLRPGLRLQNSSVTIADEDFDDFIKGRSTAKREGTQHAIASYFERSYLTDAYSSTHIADAYLAANRAKDLLRVIESDAQAQAISDPVLRRQTQVRRLKLSLAACHNAGSNVDVLKTILISAEAEKDDSKLASILASELDLSVEFGGPSLRREILLDPDRVDEHGSYLAQDAVRAARANDRVTAREQLHFHGAWLRRRQKLSDQQREDWDVTDQDVAARVETILRVRDAAAAVDEILRWRPRSLPMRVAAILVPQLIASGSIDLVEALLADPRVSGPWDLAIRVPLAMSGAPPDASAIGRSLKSIRKLLIPNVQALSSYSAESDWPKGLLDIFLTSCELAYLIGVDAAIIDNAVAAITDVLEEKKARQLYGFEYNRLDGLLRCWLLRNALSGATAPKSNDFIDYIKSLEPPPPRQEAKKKGAPPQRDRHEEERRNKKIGALFPIYAGRLDIIQAAKRGNPITPKQMEAVGAIAGHSYDFDYDHESSYLRDMAARSVSRLLIIKDIDEKELIVRAAGLIQGKFRDPFATRRIPLWKSLSLCASQSGHVVELAAEAANAVKAERAAASDKVEALIRLSRLVRPLSKGDAQILFNDAVGITKEIDEEAVDQIDFLAVAAEHASFTDPAKCRPIAHNVYTFVTGASERLSDRSRFPWRSGVSCITHLDGPLALAALGRWADDGTIGLQTTLSDFLRAALQKKIVTAPVAQSLAVLVSSIDMDVWKELAAQAAGATEGKAWLEELARDVLLLNGQAERRERGNPVIGAVPVDPKPDGPWLTQLKSTLDFIASLKTQPQREDATPYATINDRNGEEPPKEFDFVPVQGNYTSTSSITNVLKAAADSGMRHSNRDILKKMRDASAHPSKRVPYLDALMAVPDEALWFGYRIEILEEALSMWSAIPSVQKWCRETLPEAIVKQFAPAARYLKEGSPALPKLLALSQLGNSDRLRVLAEGVSRSGDALGSRTLFGVAESMAESLDPEDAATILEWYASRAVARLPSEGLAIIPLQELPATITEAIGRFVFALMSDIDTRVRWRAAHAMRRMARLGCADEVKAACNEASRIREPAFRSDAPFYFLAAKFWLMLAIHRISAETPGVLTGLKDMLLEVTTSASLPHVSIRENAKRALLTLKRGAAIALTPQEEAKLSNVNKPLKGTVPRGNRHPSFNGKRDRESRFKYNAMDTLRYWYEDILHAFPTVNPEEVLDLADVWIIDRWGADLEANWWDKEPRRARFNERRFGAYSNDHGSLPTLERYGTHLEWHAMHCVMGELLLTHPISDETDYSSFGHWLSESLPTDPPEWLSDHRGATPLEDRFWVEDSRADNVWVRSVRQNELRRELFGNPPVPGWITVGGYYTIHYSKRQVDTSISSVLVSQATAASLVRAMQTADSPHDVYLPGGDEDLREIDEAPYRLVGWLQGSHGDERFDGKDPLRYEVSRLRTAPGRAAMQALGLELQKGTRLSWVRSANGSPAFIYEAWCDEPAPEEEYARRTLRSEGWRLWVAPDALQELLLKKQMDLVCKVLVNRRLRSEYGRSYEPDAKRNEAQKIYRLRSDGVIEDANRPVGAWKAAGPGTKVRTRRRHTQ